MTTTKQKILNRLAVIFLIAGMVFTSVPTPVYAVLYSPGETLNPSCLPTDANCTVTPFLTTNNTSSVNLGPTATTAGSTAELKFQELTANGTNYTGFKSPDALAANVLYTLPSADGSSGQVLSTNAAGALSWVTSAPSQWTTSSSNIYYNTGNVGIGTAAPTANLSFGATTATINNVATNGALMLSSNGTGNITLVPGTSGTVLIGNSPTQGVFIGGGSFLINTSPQIISIGQIFPSAPIIREGLRFLEPSWINGVAVPGNNYVGFQSPGVDLATTTVWSLPVGDGTSGQVLSTDGVGSLSWLSTLTPMNGFAQNGNSFGGLATLGTIDNNALRFVSNNTEAMRILANGNIGIGTNTPTAKLEISPSGTAGVTWSTKTAPTIGYKSVVFGNGIYVAVADTNLVATSPDSITWTQRSIPTASIWRSVTYGNNLFVVVGSAGSTGTVMTSPDGITWTNRTPAANNSWEAVTYANNLFVAVASSGTGNRVMTSPDGIAWTSRTSASDDMWRGVTFGNGTFVAVSFLGSTFGAMTSSDGVTWTGRTTPSEAFNEVTYGNGLFVAVSEGGVTGVATSPDGITWTSRTPAANLFWRGVTYGNGLFAAVAGSGTNNRVMTSSDGIIWTSRISAADNNWNGIAFGNNLFVAVADSGTTRVMTSSGASPSAIVANGSVTVGGNIMPTSNNAYDLGSSVNRWRDMYLSGTTLYIGDQTLSNQSGSLTWSGTSIAAAPSVTSTSELKLSELSTNGANYTGFKSPDALAANVLYTLPSADGSSGQVLSTNAAGALSWATSASSQWTTSGSNIYYNTGNVGIGVASPTSKLQVAGVIESTGLLFSEGGNAALGFNYPDTTYDRRLRLTAGKTDTADNSQGASIDLHGNALGGSLDLVAGGATGALTFWTNNLQRAVIGANGNVGIGTITPTTMLAVVGGNVSIMSSPPFSVTGGTITTSGLYTIHTFTSSGTFTSNGAVNVEYLVVAGGGGGGGADGTGGGGGGAGGLLTGSITLSAGSYTVGVGLGGTAGTAGGSGTLGGNGGNSSFDSINTVGGGGGGRGILTTSNGLSGGSGGGSGTSGAGGSGTVGQGNNGGNGSSLYGGGGGGAGAVGGSNGVGGAGTASSISGTSVTYAGGGGAGTGSSSVGQPGGSGGGGTGGGSGGAATVGINSLGAGGGGARWGQNGAAGGSGVVIARYLTPSSTGGNVGIGTTTPNNALAVNGGITLVSTTPATTANALYNQAGTLYWNGSTVGGSSQWTTSGSNIYYNTGNVAIGTSTPSATARLLISGAVPAATTNSGLVSTGGTILGTAVGGTDTVIQYNSNGAFTPPTGVTSVQYLVIAGGGGGGSAIAGGGGAGGYLTGTTTVAAQSYSINVGAGGAGGVGASVNGSSGSNSVFSTITAIGGGGGTASTATGITGGSGGGVRGNFTGGLGTSGQGNNGGAGAGQPTGSGGGGAVSTGNTATASAGGAGGNGTVSSITGSSQTYAGGGGGGGYVQGPTTAGAGGTGGGGAGGVGANGTAGTANTGGGGGGGGYSNAPVDYSGGNGGSGVVIVRFATQTTAPADQALLRVTDTGTVTSSTLAFFEGTSGQGCIIAGQTTSLACSSDISFKKNVKDMDSSLGNVLALRPVIFDWNNEADDSGNHVGFIAQEVENIYPGLVVTDPNGKKALAYDKFAPILTKAIQELSAKIDRVLTVLENGWRRLTADELCLTDSSGQLVCVTGDALKNLNGATNITPTINMGTSDVQNIESLEEVIEEVVGITEGAPELISTPEPEPIVEAEPVVESESTPTTEPSAEPALESAPEQETTSVVESEDLTTGQSE